MGKRLQPFICVYNTVMQCLNDLPAIYNTYMSLLRLHLKAPRLAIVQDIYVIFMTNFAKKLNFWVFWGI